MCNHLTPIERNIPLVAVKDTFSSFSPFHSFHGMVFEATTKIADGAKTDIARENRQQRAPLSTTRHPHARAITNIPCDHQQEFPDRSPAYRTHRLVGFALYALETHSPAEACGVR